MVLVDERGRRVGRRVAVGRGARQHHEVGGAGRVVKRIIRQEWDEHRAAAALVHKVEAVIEELPEQREP